MQLFVSEALFIQLHVTQNPTRDPNRSVISGKALYNMKYVCSYVGHIVLSPLILTHIPSDYHMQTNLFLETDIPMTYHPVYKYNCTDFEGFLKFSSNEGKEDFCLDLLDLSQWSSTQYAVT